MLYHKYALKETISDFFKGLPDEVLLHVFSFVQHKPTLVNLMLTSWRCNRIALAFSYYTVSLNAICKWAV